MNEMRSHGNRKSSCIAFASCRSFWAKTRKTKRTLN